jgi:uncharacterized lipoprotein YmbA
MDALRAMLLALACVMLGACASKPPALIALPAAAQANASGPNPDGAGPTILLRRVTVPGYLDGFGVVIGRRAQTMVIAPDAEWAERLSDASARVLRAALSQRLGPGRVLIEGDGRIPDADLTVEILALEPDGHGRLVLDARWSFVAAGGERASHAGRTRLDVPLGAAEPSAVAAATAQALGRFADVLAREVATLHTDARIGADARRTGRRS